MGNDSGVTGKGMEFRFLAGWNRDDTVRALLLAAVALAIWGFSAAMGERHLIYPDAMEYAQTARSIAQGEGAKTNSIWVLRTAYPLEFPPADVRRPLLWPLVESVFFLVLGASDWVAQLSSACMGAVAVALLYTLARKFLGSIGAFLTALVFLFQPMQIRMNQSGLSEPLFTALLLSCFLLWLNARTPRRWLALGLLIGLCQWVRLNGFILVIPFAVALFWDRKERWKLNLGMFFLGLAIPLAPLVVRNMMLLGEPSILNLARYSIVGEIGPYPDHGAERALEKISVFSVFASHPVEVVAKYFRGLGRNLDAAFAAGHPLLWGLWIFLALSPGKSPGRRLVLLTLGVLALFWLMFSIGEFEGPRFYVPVAPLVILGAVIALSRLETFSFLKAGPGEKGPPWFWWPLLVVLLLPGVFLLYETANAQREGAGGYREQLGRLIQSRIPEGSVVATDVPWAVGWYGQRVAVWLPLAPEQIQQMNRRIEIDAVFLTSGVAGGDWAQTPWAAVHRGMYNFPGYRRVYPLEHPGPFVLFRKTGQSL